MSEAVIMAIIALVGTTIASIISAIVTIKTGRKVDQVARQTNGMMGQLISSAREEGVKTGLLGRREGDRAGDDANGEARRWP